MGRGEGEHARGEAAVAAAAAGWMPSQTHNWRCRPPLKHSCKLPHAASGVLCAVCRAGGAEGQEQPSVSDLTHQQHP